MIKQWDMRKLGANNSAFVGNFTGHSRGVLCLQMCVENNQAELFSGGEDCTIRKWDLQQRQSTVVLNNDTYVLCFMKGEFSQLVSCFLNNMSTVIHLRCI